MEKLQTKIYRMYAKYQYRSKSFGKFVHIVYIKIDLNKTIWPTNLTNMITIW